VLNSLRFLVGIGAQVSRVELDRCGERPTIILGTGRVARFDGQVSVVRETCLDLRLRMSCDKGGKVKLERLIQRA